MTPTTAAAPRQLVTVRVDGQLFGLDVLKVQDVLKGQRIARIPLAPREVSGALNLRGRIVTAVDLRARLSLPPRDGAAPQMGVVVEHRGEWFSLVVDSVGDVLTPSAAQHERTPANLEERWKSVSSGVYRLKDELLVVLDIPSVLDL